jgi:hypothetical protein
MLPFHAFNPNFGPITIIWLLPAQFVQLSSAERSSKMFPHAAQLAITILLVKKSV